MRAQLGRAEVPAIELARRYGGAPSYWTRRIKGLLPFTTDDLEAIAEATGVHIAVLLDGEAPQGWLPRQDSNLQPSDYEFRLFKGAA